MRISEAWLREWVNPEVDVATLAHQLTMAGLEVEAIEPSVADFSGVVIGRVKALEPHPNADKLRVCSVDIGQPEAVQIICGAANVAADMKVPVATLGALLPGDFKIKRAKLRGVESFGMICSAAELGLAESSDGILPLPADAPVGEDFRAWAELDDHEIEIGLTPDRGDCLSIAGIAREVGVIDRLALHWPDLSPLAATIDTRVTVALEAPEACPRYIGRVIEGVDPQASTPFWMREKLRRCGLRSIDPLVDVTNYVMLELGQPMHAFDLAKIEGGVHARMAKAGEKLALLNGEHVELRDDTLVIADDDKPLAMAGIMGGADSAVSADTRDILLEAAHFAPLAIAGRARGYGLHTDSSHRFERGVDASLPARAMERATALILAIAGGRAGPLVEAVEATALPARRPIALRAQRIERLLGVGVPAETVGDILRRLEMRVEAAADGWTVTPPPHRFDIAIEADLIEEVGRIFGYENIPDRRASSVMRMHPTPESHTPIQRARLLLVDRDYQEAITYSFVSPEIQRQLAPDDETIALANPISADMSVMRTSLWPGLVLAASYNLARQQNRVRLFETGLRFRRSGDEIDQQAVLGGLVCGTREREQWGLPGEKVDFFDIKADVEALLKIHAVADECRFVAAEHPALHPGQSARILRGERLVGWVGTLHPRLEKALDLPSGVCLFELLLEALEGGRIPAFQPLSRFPAIRRDFALVMDQGIEYGQVEAVVREVGGALLRDVRLFDVYTGENIESGLKSLALSLILQDYSETLIDERVDELCQDILAGLSRKLGISLRD